MHRIFSTLIIAATALSMLAAENLAPTAFSGQQMPDGITAEIKDGKVTVVVNGGKRSKSFWIPLNPEWKFIRLSMELSTENVVPGKQSWQNGRLAMEFRDAKRSRTGKWLSVFASKGTKTQVCKKIYEIPAEAGYLKIEPANFGESGRVILKDIDIRGYIDPNDAIEDVPSPDGRKDAQVFSIEDAWRVSTPSRERVCLNGLWRFRPVVEGEDLAKIPKPGSGWGFFKIPSPWKTKKSDLQDLHISPLFPVPPNEKFNTAWYKRAFEIPANWNGRRIFLNADLIQTCGKVFVDGAPAGEFYYPGGELELTKFLKPGSSHELVMMISAIPEEKALFMAPGRLVKSGKKLLDYRGILGDLWLDSIPSGASVSDVHVITSVAKKKIKFDTGFTGKPSAPFILSAEIKKNDKTIRKFNSAILSPDSIANNRISFEQSWENPELWDIDKPENLYTAELSLLDKNGKILDTFLPQKFGFREFTVKGRDFYLNGRRIHLRALVSSAVKATAASKEHIDHLVDSARGFGINFLIGWNYNFAPGIFSYYDSFHRRTSERGMLTSVTLPHVSDFDLKLQEPAVAEAYRKMSEHIIRRFQNLPGVILYVMNHNATGYRGDLNPLRIGNDYMPEKVKTAPRLPLRADAARAEKIAKSIDPTRPVYHHESGNLGDVYTINTYLNWAPRQERDDWFENWEQTGTMPVIIVEWGIPHVASWSSYRGPRFIWSSAAVQCLWINEYNAAILGEEAYRDHAGKRTAADAQTKLLKGNQSIRFGAMTKYLGMMPDMDKIRVYMLSRNIRSMRARGMSGLLPWDQHVFWKMLRTTQGRNPEPFKGIKNPGIVPDRFYGGGQFIENRFGKFARTEPGSLMYREFSPLLGWIGGRTGDFTENSHVFTTGEKVCKSLIILNDTRRIAEVPYKWEIPELNLSQNGKVRIEAGGRCDIPLEFRIPSGFTGKQIAVNASFDFAGQGRMTDTLKLDIMRPLGKPALKGKVGLIDPEGTAAPLLDKLGVKYSKVKTANDLRNTDILILGRSSLKRSMPDLHTRLGQGMKLLVLEQDSATMKQLGFRINEQGLREIFANTGDFSGKVFRDWRGKSTLLPPYIETPEYEQDRPRWKWEEFSTTRVWRAGNRGTVASVIPEKPPIGCWKPLLQGGFDLQYSPLMEYRQGKTHILFSQLDISGRTEVEPESLELLKFMLERLDRAGSQDSRKVFYAGDANGKALLKSLQIPFAEYKSGTKTDSASLLVLGGNADTGDLKKIVENGTNVLALGLDRKALETAFPGMFRFEKNDGYADFVKGLHEIPEFDGLSNADLHWREKLSLDAFPKDSWGGSSLNIKYPGKGKVAAYQLPPWKFDGKEFYNRTTVRRSTFAAARLLANLGAVSEYDMAKKFTGKCFESAAPLPNGKWMIKSDPEKKGGKERWFAPSFKMDDSWRPVRIGQDYNTQYPDFNGHTGHVWYRLEFELPEAAVNNPPNTLSLGKIDDESWVWLNGEFIGEISEKTNPENYWEVNRKHKVPAGLLRKGKNVISVLCVNLRGNGGLYGIPLFSEKSSELYPDTAIESDNPYRYYRW